MDAITTPDAVSQPAVVIQPVDDTSAIMTKFVVAVLVGPKLGPLLAQLGIPMDPTLLSVIVMTALHKSHQILKKITGWDFL